MLSTMRNENCVKCGKIMKGRGKLCRECYLSASKRKHYSCVVCGAKISTCASYGKGKCRKCYFKEKFNNRLYWQNHDWLYDHYINKEMSMPQIASLVDAYQSIIGRWLHLFNIPMRSQGGITPRRYTDKRKYVNLWLPNHPTASKSRPYKREHVIVMEKHLGRILSRTEVVHHMNGIRTDNRIENLKYFTNNSTHKLFEGQFNLFAKRLVWGDIKPELKQSLQDLFTQFCQGTM
jgi:hypothetical protein